MKGKKNFQIRTAHIRIGTVNNTGSPIRLFIGYDPCETVSFQVASHSVMQRSSLPVSITGLLLSQLPIWREREEHQSTDFTFSRFLVPWLCNYRGWAIYMDCDMLFMADISDLFALKDERYAVQVVKHDHVPREETKFLGKKQMAYAKKNWSSLMLFNTDLCPTLTPEYVNYAKGLDLHQFRWLGGEHLIGELPSEWNHLVGYDSPSACKVAHYTLGSPCFAAYRNCEYSNEWFEERRALMDHDSWMEYSRPSRTEL
jgi:hypothetical protein